MQHLFSAVADKLFKADTVGWSLGQESVSVDLALPLSGDQLAQIEHDCNEMVRKGSQVKWKLYSREELAGSAAEGAENDELSNIRGGVKGAALDLAELRMVSIEGLDLNPCGGTHLRSLSEINLVKVVGTEKAKGGVRVRFVAGERAIAYFEQCVQREAVISAKLSVPAAQWASHLDKLMKERKDASKRLDVLSEELAGYYGSALAAAASSDVNAVVAEHRTGADLKFLIKAAESVLAARPSALVFLSGDDLLPLSSGAAAAKKGGKTEPVSGPYVLFGGAEATGRTKEGVQAIVAGRGGGRPGRLQGQAAGLEKLEQVREYLTAEIVSSAPVADELPVSLPSVEEVVESVDVPAPVAEPEESATVKADDVLSSQQMPTMNVNAPVWAPPVRVEPVRDAARLTQDEAVDELLQCMQPHEAQLEYRSSAVDLLKKQVRLALGANAEEDADLEPQPSEEGEDSTQEPTNAPEFVPCPHKISSVDFIAGDDSSLLSHRVTCVVDGSLQVEIIANNRAELCMLAFFEDLAALVGQHHLLKRAFLLIRSWWVYETAAYVGSAVHSNLSDFTLCVMVCSVFNQYMNNITTPFQALWIFLREYECYNGETHAITLQGIVPFASEHSNQPRMIVPHEGHLISAQLLDKYRQLYAIGSSAPITESSGMADGGGMGGMGMQHPQSGYPGSYSMYGGGSGGMNRMPPAPMMAGMMRGGGGISGSRRNQLAQQEMQFAALFERHGFNVVHPFGYSNMVTEKLSARRLVLVGKAFRIGKANLSFAMQKQEHQSFHIVTDFFPAVVEQFYAHWRPDTFAKSIKDAPPSPHWSSPK